MCPQKAYNIKNIWSTQYIVLKSNECYLIYTIILILLEFITRLYCDHYWSMLHILYLITCMKFAWIFCFFSFLISLPEKDKKYTKSLLDMEYKGDNQSSHISSLILAEISRVTVSCTAIIINRFIRSNHPLMKKKDI